MCSLGYAALCFPRIAKKYRGDWGGFCKEIFGICINEDYNEWFFLFGARWSQIDNTITGAADRITYFLKYGVPDDCWNPEVYRRAS